MKIMRRKIFTIIELLVVVSILLSSCQWVLVE